MIEALIKILGGYTLSEVKAVGHRKFTSYDEIRRLGRFLPVGSDFEFIGNDIELGEMSAVWKFEGFDNNGT